MRLDGEESHLEVQLFEKLAYKASDCVAAFRFSSREIASSRAQVFELQREQFASSPESQRRRVVNSQNRLPTAHSEDQK